MTQVFADTSALIALRDAGDAKHEAATRWLGEALSEGSVRLVLSQYILGEVHAFFCRAPEVALAYCERIQSDSAFRVARATPGDEAEAWSILRRSRDKTYSFVDAVSFAMMRRLGIATALSFDAHFRQYGRFTVVP